MRRANDAVELFLDLGKCGRRAIRRGPSRTIERLVDAHRRANKRFIESASTMIDSLKSMRIDLDEFERTANFREVKDAVATVRDEWASEAFFYVHDWDEFGVVLDELGKFSFAECLAFLQQPENENRTPEVLDYFFRRIAVPLNEILDADTAGLLSAYTCEEVLLGYGRLASMADFLQFGWLPDERYTDYERQLYFSASTVGERERDWLFHDMWRYTENLEARFSRAEQFGQLMLLAPASSQSVADYLIRVQKVFVEGLVPETLIMCRAVLEQSVTNVCRLLVPEFESMSRFELGQKIKALEEAKIFPQRVINDARAIAARGNKAVHVGPNLVADAYATVALTSGVLNKLESELARTSRDT